MPAIDRVLGLTVAVALTALPFRPAATQDFAGAELIARTAARLASDIETRGAELEADRHALYGLVDDLLLPRFDLSRGSRAILAEHWDRASTEERDRFIAAFYNYLVTAYADLLLHFRADTLTVLPFEGDPQGSSARVRSVLRLNDGTEIDVDFVMLNGAESWKVIDIVAEGISYVRTYRSQFRVDIATEGLGSVIAWLEQKAATRLTEAGADR